jgi:hypothetical protein
VFICGNYISFGDKNCGSVTYVKGEVVCVHGELYPEDTLGSESMALCFLNL